MTCTTYRKINQEGNGLVEYAVEMRRRQTRWTVGLVHGTTGRYGGWTAPGIRMPAWTARKGTRADAVAAMLARTTVLDEQKEAVA